MLGASVHHSGTHWPVVTACGKVPTYAGTVAATQPPCRNHAFLNLVMNSLVLNFCTGGPWAAAMSCQSVPACQGSNVPLPQAAGSVTRYSVPYRQGRPAGQHPRSGGGEPEPRRSQTVPEPLKTDDGAIRRPHIAHVCCSPPNVKRTIFVGQFPATSPRQLTGPVASNNTPLEHPGLGAHRRWLQCTKTHNSTDPRLDISLGIMHVGFVLSATVEARWTAGPYSVRIEFSQ